MEDNITTAALIQNAITGDQKAEAEIYSKLAVRFSEIIISELSNYPILFKRIDLTEQSLVICQSAVDKLKTLYPLNSKKWSLHRAVGVLYEVLDEFITNSLTDLAQHGDAEAENLLFSMLRKKLAKRIDNKINRGDSKHAC